MTEKEVLKELAAAAARLVLYEAEVVALKAEAVRLKAKARAEFEYSENLLRHASSSSSDYGLSIGLADIKKAIQEESETVDAILAYIMRDSRMDGEDT
jgi:hypothetical protein